MNIIILGPQGSGKGTQAELLVKRYNLFYFESGGFLRELAKVNPRVDEIINKKGELIPDEEIFSYISKYLEEDLPKEKSFLLDGYPRSVRQYELLEEWLTQRHQEIGLAIFLEVSEEESIKRLSARRICSKCGEIYNLITNPPPERSCPCGGKLSQRKDDKPEAIKRRLELYRKETEPLIKVLDKEGILMKVDGERPINVIFGDIVTRLKTYEKG